jgi:dTDP-4-amino-4,6-dideoxygalactose transaminase
VTTVGVPLVDLQAQYRSIRTEIDRAVARVLDRGWFVLGAELKAFEEAFAAYCGVAHAIGVGSGTEALHLALVALGAGEGREVIAPANTAVPTVSAISFSGARPVLVDVEEETATIDAGCLEEAITSRTAAVVAVHLYGQCAAMGKLREICDRRGVPVVEDAAQAHGAEEGRRRAGSLGVAGAFSFYPSKNLGAYGDGGMLTTDDRALAERLRRLRNYGQLDSEACSEVGFNSRLDEIQAAILHAKLPHLDRWNEKRRAIASRYQEELTGLPIVWNREAAGRRHVRHLCVARFERREALRAFLTAQGIQTKVHYAIPIHLQEAYAFLGHQQGDFPVTERLASSVLSLPMYPELTKEAQDQVIKGIQEWFDRSR